DVAVLQLPPRHFQPVPELSADPVVGPRLDVLVRGDLQVEPADLRGAHGVQGEAVLVPAVDELVGGGRHVGQDAEPGVRVLALGHPDEAGRHGIAADAVEAVAASDGFAYDFMTGAPSVGEAEDRSFGIKLSDLGVGDLELDHGPGRQPGPDQVLDDLGLGVDRHPAPAGQVAEVEVMPFALELQVDPAVFEALGVHPVAQADRADQFYRARLDPAGPLP